MRYFSLIIVGWLNGIVPVNAECQGSENLRVFGILASSPESKLIGDKTIANKIVYRDGEFVGNVGDFFALNNGTNKFKVLAPNSAIVSIVVSYVKDNDNCVQKGLQKVTPRDGAACAAPSDIPLKLSQWSGYDTVTKPHFSVVLGPLKFKKRPFPNGCLDFHSSAANIIYHNMILNVESNVETAEVSIEGKSAGTLNLNAPISIPYPAHVRRVAIALKKPGHANCQILIQNPGAKHSAKCELLPF